MTDNSKIVAFPDLSEIEMQAAEWIMRQEEGGLSAEDLADFHAWKGAHNSHRDAFDRLCRLWGQFDIMEELIDYAAAEDNIKSVAAEVGPYGRVFNRRSILVGSTALIATTFGAAIYKIGQSDGGKYHNLYQTAVGEQHKFSLPDGSTIELNTNSQVKVVYTQRARSIWLLYGEAHFDVASDVQRPFSVYASDGIVTAVGTAYTVRLHTEDIEVTVVEGRVSLSTLEPSRNDSSLSDIDLAPVMQRKVLAEVKAGQNAAFHDRVEWVKDMEFSALERKLSWREGVLVFSGESLSEVLGDIGRYTDITIEITDEGLKNLPVAGYLKIGNLDAMLEALKIMADVRVEHINPKLVRLYKARHV